MSLKETSFQKAQKPEKRIDWEGLLFYSVLLGIFLGLIYVWTR